MSNKKKSASADNDDDWGDDAGDAAETANDDDADWGATNDDDTGDVGGDDDDGDGGNNNEEWDSTEFEEQDGDTNANMQTGGDEQGGEGELELTVDIQIANIFYEAEDMVRDHPVAALNKFLSVLELCRSVHSSSLSDESRTAMFSSLVHIVVLSYETGKVGDMVSYYEQLLSLIPSVTRNEGAEAIDSVLNAVSNSKDFSLLEKIYSITSNYLESLPDTERMLFTVKMKLCKSYVERGDYALAQKVLESLHDSCRLNDGTDDKKNKGAELIEIYAAMIKISFATKDNMKMKSLYEATKDLSAAVKDPRSQSVIRECWGFMFGSDGLWPRAYAEFYSAFIHYQEIGNRERAKQCLKYVVIANMLSGGEQNPFDAREAKVYQNDADIASIVGLRTAYEKCDVAAFNACLHDILQNAYEKQETFIPEHLDSISKDFQQRALIQISRAYRRLRLSHLAALLQIDVSRVERLLVGLILDGLLIGKIDSVAGLLDLTPSTAESNKRYETVDAWIQALQELESQVTHPVLPQYT